MLQVCDELHKNLWDISVKGVEKDLLDFGFVRWLGVKCTELDPCSGLAGIWKQQKSGIWYLETSCLEGGKAKAVNEEKEWSLKVAGMEECLVILSVFTHDKGKALCVSWFSMVTEWLSVMLMLCEIICVQQVDTKT